MSKSRRLAMMGLSVVATGALFAGTAAAETTADAAANGGTAKAESLQITIAGQTLAGSSATASVDLAKQVSDALASEMVTPLVTDGGKGHATATNGQSNTAKPDKCTGSDLTAVPGIARFDITCGQADAAFTATDRRAHALGADLVVEPSVSGVLSTLKLQDPAQQAAGQVSAGLEQALNPLVQGLTGTPLKDLVQGADTTVQDVLSKILTLKSTARIVVAPALAEVTANGDTVVSHARSQGIRIELLPVDGAGATNNLLPDDLKVGEPLVTITIGNAEITKTAKAGAPATVDGKASTATIHFGTNALSSALGLNKQDITVPVNQEVCLLNGTPLESCVKIASVDATAGTADSASVQLFKGVNGGIDITTGRASVGAGQQVATLAAVAPAPDLPRTGGNPALPIIGGGLLAAGLVTRRYTVGRR